MSGQRIPAGEDNREAVGHEKTPCDLIEQTVRIVAAYIGRHNLLRDELPGLISAVHKSLLTASVATEKDNLPETPPSRRPAVSIRASVTPDAIICLEDGKPFKSLRRHLKTSYNLTPDEYRQKWGLPDDYPMVAPNYSQRRSQLAKSTGLGRVRSRG